MGKMFIYRIQKLILFINYQKSAHNIQCSFIGYFNQEMKNGSIDNNKL